MSMRLSVPKFPTHAVKYINNWDGEGDIEYTFAFLVEGEFYDWGSGLRIIEYVGDEVLDSWELKESLTGI